MDLTREQAIKEHRKLWNWIADETIGQEIKVEKWEYFSLFKFIQPIHACYCCEYAKNVCMSKSEDFSMGKRCQYCPIEWGEESYNQCVSEEITNSYYSLWEECKSYNYIIAANLARLIAELPEREI